MSEESINFEEEFSSEETGKEKKRWEEHFTVNSDELVGKVQELIKEAAVRKITIKDESGKTLLTIPMYAGIEREAPVEEAEEEAEGEAGPEKVPAAA
jgi:hypothetical protein